jgi:hypothetical protein
MGDKKKGRIQAVNRFPTKTQRTQSHNQSKNHIFLSVLCVLVGYFDNGNMQNKFYPPNSVYNFWEWKKENLTFH